MDIYDFHLAVDKLLKKGFRVISRDQNIVGMGWDLLTFVRRKPTRNYPEHPSNCIITNFITFRTG